MVKSRLNSIRRLLSEKKCSLVIDGAMLRAYTTPPLKSIYSVYINHPGLMRDSNVACTVLGLTGASFLVMEGVRAVYADVISEPAYNLLLGSRMAVLAEKVVPSLEGCVSPELLELEKRCVESGEVSECIRFVVDYMLRS